MASAFRKISAYAKTGAEDIARKQAAIAACLINDYINWLGFRPSTQTESERAITLPGNHAVTGFNPPRPFKGLPIL